MIKRTNISVNTKPRDIKKITELSGNLYKSVVILSKRANQIAKQEKDELVDKLAEFAPKNDNLEEIFDNREQMEISAHYEKLPKPTLVAIEEFLDNKVYFRDPDIVEETNETF
jgi:DNA-directed RNA polymerase subunit K/omega